MAKSSQFTFYERTEGVFSVASQFHCLSVDDQLGLLWAILTEVDGSFTFATARLQLIQGLLNQIKQMSDGEQLEFMRHLIAKVSTPLTRAYGTLTNNTKLAFWYQLVELMKQKTVVALNYPLSVEANAVLLTLQELDSDQQTTALRNIVASMGVAPFA